MISSLRCKLFTSAAPSAPRNLTILSSGPTTLGVAWRRPIPANGNITGYKLYCSGSGVQYYTDQVDPASYNMTLDGDTNSTTLMDLLPFTNYTCSISASTGAGEGVRSDEVSATTDETSKFSYLLAVTVYLQCKNKIYIFMYVAMCTYRITKV